MPKSTERQILNQGKRIAHARGSFERASALVAQAIANPTLANIGAADSALDGATYAASDARLWAGRLYGSDKRYAFTLILENIAKLRASLPRI